jgi:2-keto-3-deoxy-L-arabinonate dehydratase
MAAQPYRGIFPIAPTPFNDNGSLDLDGMGRILDCMVDQGVDGICILANFSEQFALSDAERDSLTGLCLDHVAGRVPVIVTTSHFCTDIAVARAKAAEARGASMLMIMPPYHGTLIKADDQGIFEHFTAIADAVNIPIMVQDAPLAGVHLSVELLAKMAKALPTVSYFKMEMPQAAAKLRALIAAAGDHIDGPFDGEESITLMADLNAGATGTMCSALLPDLIRPVVMDFLDGQRDRAREQYERILPLINFENRQCGFRAAKAVMVEGGVIRSEKTRHPVPALHPDTRSELIDMARRLDPLAIRWGR